MIKYRDHIEQRRVEMLQQYYAFDEETKTFDVTLHFESAHDLFNEHLNLMKKRVMKDEVVEEVASLLRDIPKGYKAKLSLAIDDYGDIPYEEILDAFHNALNLRLTRFHLTQRKKFYKVGTLMLIGTFLIALMILGEILHWWGGEAIEGRLVSYLLDTAGCVLIWEGLYSALLERDKDASLGYVLSSRLSSIALYQKDTSGQALWTENKDDVVVVDRPSRGKNAGSICLYLSGFFLAGVGVIGILLRAPLLAEIISVSGVMAAVAALLELLSSFFLCGLGFLAIMMYRENYRYFILTSIISVFLLALVILSFVSLFLATGSMVNVITSVASLLAMILFVIGFGLSTYYHRHDIVKTFRKNQ